jgi:hypothetical protein
MTKNIAAAVLLIVALLFFSFSLTKAESIGLGITDFQPTFTITVGETKEIEVARLYNTGNFDLDITSSWIANSNSSGLTVKTNPNTLYLMSQEASSIYLSITGTELGRYDGYVDFNCSAKIPENYKGNPTTPGGRVNAVFYVVEKPPVSVLSISSLPIVVVIIGIIGIFVWHFLSQKKTRSNGHRSKYLHSLPCAKNSNGKMEGHK